MSFEDGLKLVKLRGESMQAAADAVQSGMVSVIGLDSAKVRGAGGRGLSGRRGEALQRRARLQPLAAPGLTHPPTPARVPHPRLNIKVEELCKAATAEVGEDKAIRIANYLCNGAGGEGGVDWLD
jgi:malonyl CoA-acyl carrier protein transacylase